MGSYGDGRPWDDADELAAMDRGDRERERLADDPCLVITGDSLAQQAEASRAAITAAGGLERVAERLRRRFVRSTEDPRRDELNARFDLAPHGRDVIGPTPQRRAA